MIAGLIIGKMDHWLKTNNGWDACSHSKLNQHKIQFQQYVNSGENK